MSAANLRIEGVTWAPSSKAPLLLQKSSFEVPAGQTLGVVGPNGAGKTTLLRLIYGFNRPRTGEIYVGNDTLSQLPPRVAAQRVAAVLQEQPTDFALSVRDIVALGRVPHRTGFVRSGQRDEEIIEAALDRMDLHGMASRSLSTLSGGERQRVMVARALAQEPQVLVLDEPTNHLDIRHQLEVLQLIRELGLTIVTSLHDLNLAADVCDRILVLQNGKTMAVGTPREVLCDKLVSETFSVQARLEELSLSHKPHFSFQLSNETHQRNIQ